MPTSSDQHGDAKLLHEAHSLCMPSLNAHHERAQLVAAKGVRPCSQGWAGVGHGLNTVPEADRCPIGQTVSHMLKGVP